MRPAAVRAIERACVRADGIRGLRGWRSAALAFLSGLLSALAFAPFGIFPLLLLSFAVLVLLLDGAQAGPRPVWRSALIGWAYGLGQFLAGLYWVAYAFLVDPLQHAWQIPFVALLFPGGLALFQAAACALAVAFWRPGWPRIFLFTAAYALAEWLRGHILTGFPWNLPGYGWGASLAVLQSVSLFGVYGLTLLTVLFGASLALLGDKNKNRARAIPAAFAALFVAFWTGGVVRLALDPTQTVPGVRLRIVQPNVAQADKYVPALRAAHWQELLGMSVVRHGPPPTHIIWPEAAPPFLLARSPQALNDIALLTGRDKTLMTGAARAELASDGKLVVHNSFYIFGPGGRLLATHDKFHLVPFGEYVPFPETLHALGIDKLVNQPGSFATGSGPRTYAVPGAPPVGPLICYEILFPAEVVADRRPGWFVNVTDDSWFGPASSTGPYQHFLVARVRAIEEGIPVVRAANTGISAIIDPLGRVVAELGVDKAGIVDAGLPKSLVSTLFARLRHLGFWLMLLACVATGLAIRTRPA
jgi:apolipoprotein N-acyltransferase